jgi:hypothetical protein
MSLPHLENMACMPSNQFTSNNSYLVDGCEILFGVIVSLHLLLDLVVIECFIFLGVRMLVGKLLCVWGLHAFVVFVLDHLGVELNAVLAAKALLVVMVLEVLIHIRFQELLCVYTCERLRHFLDQITPRFWFFNNFDFVSIDSLALRFIVVRKPGVMVVGLDRGLVSWLYSLSHRGHVNAGAMVLPISLSWLLQGTFIPPGFGGLLWGLIPKKGTLWPLHLLLAGVVVVLKRSIDVGMVCLDWLIISCYSWLHSPPTPTRYLLGFGYALLRLQILIEVFRVQTHECIFLLLVEEVYKVKACTHLFEEANKLKFL